MNLGLGLALTNVVPVLGGTDVVLGDTLTEVVSLDFVNGVYRYNGASASLTDLLVFDDPDWDVATDNSTIVPGSGWKPMSQNLPRLADGPQATVMASGLSFVAEFDYAPPDAAHPDSGMSFDLEIYSQDFGDNVYAFVQPSNGAVGSVTDGGNEVHTDATIPGVSSTAAARHKFAATLTAARASGVLDQGSVHSVQPTTPASLHFIGFGPKMSTWFEGNYLRSVIIYAPVTDATLVTITAP